METDVHKTLALLLFCFGLLFSPMALAEVPEATWDSLVGQPVLLVNPQGKEIRGTLLDAQGETIRVERPDGSVVTVGKAEVATAKSLAVDAAPPTPQPVPESGPVQPQTQDDTVISTTGPEAVAPATDPAPPPQAQAEPVPATPPVVASSETEQQDMQDRVAGEVDGRAAAQMESLTGPAAVSAGIGLASGVVCGCCGTPCAAIGPVFYAVRDETVVNPGGSEAYNQAYNQAYQAELKKRRLIWTGVGAGAGLVVGIGVSYAAGVALGTSGVIPAQNF